MTDDDITRAVRVSLRRRSDDIGIGATSGSYAQIRRRIARRRAIRYATASTVAAACLVLGALVVPQLLQDRISVEFEPAEPGPDDGALPEDGPSDEALPKDGPLPSAQPTTPRDDATYLSTNGTSVSISFPDGQGTSSSSPVDDCSRLPCVQALAVDPTSPGNDDRRVTTAYRAGTGCDTHLTFVDETTESGIAGAGRGQFCAGDPSFSPDGTRVAWFDREPGDPRAASLNVAPWRPSDDLDGTPGPAQTASVRLPDARPLDLVGWYADETGGEFLVVRATDSGPGLTIVPLVGEGDAVTPVPVDSWRRRPQLGGFARVQNVTYELTIPDAGPVLAAGTDDADITPLDVQMPDEFDAEGRTWLTASEGGVLIGDGARAWMVRDDGSIEALPGTVRHAHLVGDPESGTPPLTGDR